MVTDPGVIEAALSRAGWSAGAEALVAGWVEHRRRELVWEETWRPDHRCRYVSERPTGERFVIEWVTGDTWELSISWPGNWGSEHVTMGFLESLQSTARRIDRAEGPFGGPQSRDLPACALPDQRGRRLAGDVELRFELLRENLAAYFFITREGTLNNLWIVPLDPAHLSAALDSLKSTPRCYPSFWAQAHGERRAWSFTAWRPLLARMQIGQRELLLLCPDASAAVLLAHEKGRLHAAAQIDIDELPDFEVGWLATARWWYGTSRSSAVGSPPKHDAPSPSPPITPPRTATKTEAEVAEPVALAGHPAGVVDQLAGSAPRRPPLIGRSQAAAQPPPQPGVSLPPPPTDEIVLPLTNSAPKTGVREAEGTNPQRAAESEPAWERNHAAVGSAPQPNTPLRPPPDEDAPPVSRSVPDIGEGEAEVAERATTADDPVAEAASQPANSGPQSTMEGESPEPAGPPEQPSPRFPLSADASAEEIQRHFLEVEAAIPPRQTGAATATEIWLAIREAHGRGDLPMTGSWFDLVALLHHRGLLPHLPGDRASRAALLILAELSPLVRRLHHRRWMLGWAP